MTEGEVKHKMINALIKMAYAKSRGQHRYVSRTYAIVRSLIAAKNSEKFKGKPKSEQTKLKMKENNGKWKRNITHIEDFKLRMGDCKGSNNAFFGKSHSEETKRMWSQKRKGRVPWNKGLTKKDYGNART
jgi:hypothetical protein